MKNTYRKPELKSEKIEFEARAISCAKFGRIGNCITKAKKGGRGVPIRS